MMELTSSRETIEVPQERQLIKELAGPIFASRIWLKILGSVMFAYGILTIFSLWGILICWVPMWMGILLFKAGKIIETAQLRGDRRSFLSAMEKLRTFFKIQGILLVSSLLLCVIFFLLFGGMMMSMMSQMADMGQMSGPMVMPEGCTTP